MAMRTPRLRLTIWRMMVATAVVATLCSGLPYPFADPIAASAAAILTASILAILGRRQNPRLFKTVLLLAVVTVLAAGTQGVSSLRRRAERYRRLSEYHAGCESFYKKQIQAVDEEPWQAGGGRAGP